MRQCSEERQRLVHMLKESISLMCKTAVAYEIELTVEGLLGITLDKRDVFLVNINECFKSVLQMSADPAETGATPTPSGGAGQKRGPNDNGDSTGNRNSEDQNGKRRRGRQSMDGSGSPQPSQHNNKNNPPPEGSTDFLPNMSVESGDSLVSCEQTNSDQSTKRLQHPPSASDQPKSPQASYTETSFDVSDSGGGLDPQILSHHEDSADIDLGNISVKREISIEAADYAAHLAFSKNNSELQGSFPSSVPVPVAGSSRHNNQVPSNLSSTTPTTGSSQDSSHPGLLGTNQGMLASMCMGMGRSVIILPDTPDPIQSAWTGPLAAPGGFPQPDPSYSPWMPPAIGGGMTQLSPLHSLWTSSSSAAGLLQSSPLQPTLTPPVSDGYLTQADSPGPGQTWASFSPFGGSTGQSLPQAVHQQALTPDETIQLNSNPNIQTTSSSTQPGTHTAAKTTSNPPAGGGIKGALMRRKLRSQQTIQGQTCQECDFIATSKSDLDRHIQGHLVQIKKCPKCNRKCFSDSELENHMKLAHTKLLECDKCGMKYRSRIGLERHKMAAHQTVFRYRCEVCNKGFNQRKSVAQHMEQSHQQTDDQTQPEQFICDSDYCGAIFPSETELLEHQQLSHQTQVLEPFSSDDSD